MKTEVTAFSVLCIVTSVLMVEGFQGTKEQTVIFKNALNVNQTLKQLEARWKIVLEKLLKPEKVNVTTKMTSDVDYQDGSGEHRIVYNLTYITKTKKLSSWVDAVKAMRESMQKSPIPHVRMEDIVPGEYMADIVFE